MTNSSPRLPDLSRSSFARTNAQTIAQRATLLHELVPGLRSIAEICSGDCSRQHQVYTHDLGIQTFHGLDLEPAIVAANRARGIDCAQGDALDPEVIRCFAADEVIFFGLPLSEDCDGHRFLGFDKVTRSYEAFVRLLLGELNYAGLLVCICPNSTTLGDLTRLYHQIRTYRPDVNLRLIHHSYSTVTGNGEFTELRLKYVETWFSSQLDDVWEVRQSKMK